MVRFIIFIHLSYAHHLLHPSLYLSLPSQPRSQSKATSKSDSSHIDDEYFSIEDSKSRAHLILRMAM
ncbi:hypothetical protein HanXRQr2_Chr16g0763091 [Helianthus annuus]|uniref:Uncharacterized protein n=1 Tax=Helianthus annuus TaxID=4232 RepID=A0A9K3DUL0_HELAN|nr:hypothetical protein HanXRQr2_Chr16g0763091 [Helianthus annuus]KAJ0822366.1 hypothetical protein HanPSC8_Chr16g0731131 [Helianthus annuus]